MEPKSDVILIPRSSFTNLCRSHARALNMIKILTFACTVKQVSLVMPTDVYCSLLNIDRRAIDMAIQKGWIKAKIIGGYQVLDAYDMANLAEKLTRRSRNRKIKNISRHR